MTMRHKKGSEAFAQGDGPRAREMEIADILSFTRRQASSNTVWLPADVHYRLAYYNPDKAIPGIRSFLEFSSGPLHAGTFSRTNSTYVFGPKCDHHAPGLDKQTCRPSSGMQFFAT